MGMERFPILIIATVFVCGAAVSRAACAAFFSVYMHPTHIEIGGAYSRSYSCDEFHSRVSSAPTELCTTIRASLMRPESVISKPRVMCQQ